LYGFYIDLYENCTKVEQLFFIGLLKLKTSDSNRSIKSVGIRKVVGIDWILCDDTKFWLIPLLHNSLWIASENIISWVLESLLNLRVKVFVFIASGRINL
jgi:hypothetical protein